MKRTKWRGRQGGSKSCCLVIDCRAPGLLQRGVCAQPATLSQGLSCSCVTQWLGLESPEGLTGLPSLSTSGTSMLPQIPVFQKSSMDLFRGGSGSERNVRKHMIWGRGCRAFYDLCVDVLELHFLCVLLLRSLKPAQVQMEENWAPTFDWRNGMLVQQERNRWCRLWLSSTVCPLDTVHVPSPCTVAFILSQGIQSFLIVQQWVKSQGLVIQSGTDTILWIPHPEYGFCESEDLELKIQAYLPSAYPSHCGDTWLA